MYFFKRLLFLGISFLPFQSLSVMAQAQIHDLDQDLHRKPRQLNATDQLNLLFVPGSNYMTYEGMLENLASETNIDDREELELKFNEIIENLVREGLITLDDKGALGPESQVL